jgi:hypothetical protein
MCRRRLGKAQAAEPERGLQLVVARDQRRGWVEDADPASLDPVELPGALLDAVERPPNVQSAEHDVSPRHESTQPRWFEELRSHPPLVEGAHEELVRERRLSRDDPNSWLEPSLEALLGRGWFDNGSHRLGRLPSL